MTRARYVTHSNTAARIQKIRDLITTLQARQLRRDELGNILKVGPSGVRKYLSDLRDLVEVVFVGGEALCRLVAGAAVQAFLSSLATAAPARPVAPRQTPECIAAREPGRRFHILADDAHYPVRISREPAARDPLVAALFGAPAGGMEARA
jgi:hypothetical protein